MEGKAIATQRLTSVLALSCCGTLFHTAQVQPLLALVGYLVPADTMLLTNGPVIEVELGHTIGVISNSQVLTLKSQASCKQFRSQSPETPGRWICGGCVIDF